MSHKSWTFTTYNDGKPVATKTDLDHGQALAALRAAIAGEPVLTAVEAEREVARPVELARAA
ncbi:MAG: hypothetical protein JJE35_15460 [Thermoleophilia bacterium]|nr:hypothetical protein [Thermoleophilia bacterium]